MRSVDAYLGRRFVPGYDCLAFAREVWLEETGEDLRSRLDGLFSAERRPEARHLRAFERLPHPEAPCLVLMRGGAETHIGVYLRGRVLHLRKTGAEFQPLEIAAFGFRSVEFYR